MKSSIARIHVNDIEVGTLPADKYHQIVKSVRHTRRLYLSWAVSATALVLRKFTQFVCAMPAIAVGASFILLMVLPDTVTQLIADMRTSTPEEITHFLRRVIHLISVLAIVVFPASVIFSPRSWLFQSPFDKEISQQIRQLLEVPTEGDLRVEIIEQRGSV